MSKQGRDQNRTQRAAAVRAEQARRERNRRVALIAGIIVLLGAIVAGGAWYGAGGNDKTASASDLPPLAAGEVGLQMGKSDAPVKVVIYEDFQCPICRELESATRTYLRENAAKGKVYVEYQPIHLLQSLPYSGKALNAFAAVLHGASPEAALKLHDLLFDNQPYEQQSASVTDEQIAGWVKDAGGDNSTVRASLGTKDEAFFRVVDQLMTAQGISGTPTVFVNGKELPLTGVPQTVSTIEAAVDQGS